MSLLPWTLTATKNQENLTFEGTDEQPNTSANKCTDTPAEASPNDHPEQNYAPKTSVDLCATQEVYDACLDKGVVEPPETKTGDLHGITNEEQ